MNLYEQIKFPNVDSVVNFGRELIFFDAPEHALNDVYEHRWEHKAVTTYFVKKIIYERGFFKVLLPPNELLFAWKHRDLLNNMWEDINPQLLPVIIAKNNT